MQVLLNFVEGFPQKETLTGCAFYYLRNTFLFDIFNMGKNRLFGL